MRTMKNVLGLEATVMLKSVCSSSKVFWKKNALRLQALQFAHHFSSQTETLHNLNDESSSEKAVRTYHQRAYEKLSTAEEANVEFHSANRIIQPTVHVEMIQQYFNVGKTTAYRMLEKDKRLKACGVHNLARNMNTLQLHQKLSIVYLSWRLNCSEKEVSKLQQTYRLAKKSMKLQQKIFDQLEHEWNIDIQKFGLKNTSLKTQVSNKMLNHDLIRRMILGLHIQVSIAEGQSKENILIPHPIKNSYFNFNKSLKTLPRICTLHPDTLEERLNELRQIPEFHALQSHPRMLHLIYYHKKVSSRLDQLQQFNMRSVATKSSTKKI
ncbi:hypothetical protein E2C01_018319 [Portunus trituberculatus]|uniref:Uncharacterized protein n=1 Tax=Portunus trituberculatus TaxID=210409 RepID=A0A5B7DWI0_PORTR|nr:hypothetical protein [Portunus trituberculatus]